MMKVLVIVLGVVVVLFVGALVIGTTMSPEFAVRGSTVIAAPVDSLYARFATPRTWARWSAWTVNADTSLRYTYEGPDSGPGATMRFTSRRMGSGALRIAVAEPDSLVRYELKFAGSEMVVHGRVRLEPVGNSTRVTWQDSGTLGGNVLVRLLKPLLDRSMAAAYETSFAGLRRELGAR
jgi:hypothetical protein